MSPSAAAFEAELHDNTKQGLHALAMENQLLRASIEADLAAGRKAVDDACAEFGYDSLRFADVRHGWLHSSEKARTLEQLGKIGGAE